MRRTHRCPKCEYHEILHAPEVRDSNFDRLALAGRYGVYSKWTADEHGGFEAYMCLNCGYTELYVREPRKLEISLIKDAEILKSEPRTPYR